jgi:hypothetical protein
VAASRRDPMWPSRATGDPTSKGKMSVFRAISGWGWRRVVAVIACALACVGSCRATAEGPTREYLVKAAFVFNFAQFVEWPAAAFADSTSPVVIGIVGDDPFQGALEKTVAGKTVGGRPLSIRHLKAGDDLRSCHVLFVAPSENGRTAEILRRVEGVSVLTIGETDQFPWSGGVIRFFLEDNRVHFEINQDAAESSKLKVSSKLMKLARVFHK